MAINHPGSQSLLVCVEIKIEKVMGNAYVSFSFFQITKHEKKNQPQSVIK